MALSRTLEELELLVRREADMVNSAFVSSDEVRAYINQSWAELYDRIVLVDQEYLLRKVDVVSTGAGEYDLSVVAKTCLVRTIKIANAGTLYTAGETVTLTIAGQSPLATATATVTSVNAGTGAITALSLSFAGYGYQVTSSSNTMTMSVVSAGTGVNATVTAYLESDVYKCKGVWYQAGSAGFYNPLRRFQWDEQNLLRQTGIYEASRTLPLYRIATIMGREKLLIAPDTLGGTYQFWYYPAPPRMLVSDDRVDGRAGWDEWVIKDAAIKCLLKEESTEQASGLKALRDEIWSRVMLHAENRDASQPERIRDVRLLSRRYGYWR